MAGSNHFLATIYGTASTYDAKNGGWQTVDYPAAQYNSFPSAGTRFIAISPAQTVGGVSCNAIIQVLPTGLNQPAPQFCTDSTVSTLNTNAT